MKIDVKINLEDRHKHDFWLCYLRQDGFKHHFQQQFKHGFKQMKNSSVKLIDLSDPY